MSIRKMATSLGKIVITSDDLTVDWAYPWRFGLLSKSCFAGIRANEHDYLCDICLKKAPKIHVHERLPIALALSTLLRQFAILGIPEQVLELIPKSCIPCVVLVILSFLAPNVSLLLLSHLLIEQQDCKGSV